MRGTRIATASVRTGFAMTPLTRGAVQTRAGGQRRPPLRRGCKEAVGKTNPPVTASPCQPPLGKGAEGAGVRIATTSLRTGLAMTGLCKRCGTNPGGRTEASAPTEVQQEVPWAGDRKGRPYGSMQGMRRGGALPLPAGGVDPRPYEFFAIQIFAKKRMPVRASLLRFYAGAIALARVCAYSISRRFDCLAS